MMRILLLLALSAILIGCSTRVPATMPAASTAAAEPTRGAGPAETTPQAAPSPAAATSAATPAPASTAVASKGDSAATFVLNALLSMSKKSFRATQTILVGGSTITSTLEVAGPDRIHVATHSGGLLSESYVIGPTIYSRTGKGDWQKFTGTLANSPTSSFGMLNGPEDIARFSIQSSDFGRVGEEGLGGVRTVLYQYKVSVPELNLTGTQRLWIGLADGLPRKMQTTATAGTAATESTTTYSDYDSPSIKIEPPM